MSPALFDLGYLLASVLFILGLKGLGHPRTAVRGNLLGAVGMLVAVVTTLAKVMATEGLLGPGFLVGGLALGTVLGAVMASRVQMTGMPELVALFNGLGGAASALVAVSEVLARASSGTAPEDDLSRWVLGVAVGLSALVGCMTLSGSLLAMLKLTGGVSILGRWVRTPTWGPPWLNGVKVALLLVTAGLVVQGTLGDGGASWVWGVLAVSSLLGVLVVLPIGGADMPVVVSLLNSLSGLAAAFTGFILLNTVLVVGGSLVGASGLILTLVMCRAMNRPLGDVLFKSFGAVAGARLERTKVGSDPEEVAMLLDGAERVIVVPGYGMAVAQAQHVVKELADKLTEKWGTEVVYAIHPVAGRMPGHMNVLLAEASVPYEQLLELEEVNPLFPEADVALVIGANDTTNPAARSGEGPLAGMPILDVDKARTVVVVKRSLSPGYAGVDNDLFYLDKTLMLFGDGKARLTELVRALDEV